MFYAESAAMLMIHLFTNFYLPSSNGSLEGKLNTDFA